MIAVRVCSVVLQAIATSCMRSNSLFSSGFQESKKSNSRKSTSPSTTQCTFGATAVGDEMAFFFLGCVARPFFSSNGMTSALLLRLMNFRQTGHWERFGSPGPERFSPAMRASMRHVWQNRWPAIVSLSSFACGIPRRTTSGRSQVCRHVHANNAIEVVERGGLLLRLGLGLDRILSLLL
jgi:hypothetical protein